MNIRELLIRVGFEGGDTDRELNTIDRRVDSLKQNFLSLGTILSTVFATGAIRSLIQTADQMQNLQAQIGNSTGDMENANAQLNELAKHANDARTDVDAYASSWAKMNQGIAAFGGTTEDTTKFVDTLSIAFKVNGTEAESANAALFQLGQTMQSGVVQGEEMNSLMDAQGTLAREMMIEIAGTVPAYKDMQKAGKVTAKMLMDAINKQYPKYIAQLKNVPLTMQDVWTRVSNDVRMSIANINNQFKTVSRSARWLMDAWADFTKYTANLIDRLGGLEKAFIHLARVATPLAILLGVLKGFQILTFLTSPIGMILALGTAIGLLYDDYKTWKEGGESFIEWDKWEPVITSATDSIISLKDNVLVLVDAFAKLLGIDFTTWTLKGELEDLSKNMQDLVYMGQQLADILNGLAEFDFAKVKQAGINLWNQGKDTTPGATPPPPTPGPLPTPDKPVYKRPTWWPEWAGGPGEQIGGPKQVPGVPALPGVRPNNTTNNVTNTTNATITVNAAPGMSVTDVGQEVKRQLGTKSAAATFDPNNLLKNAGAR